jgi:23S rRNA-/tRNA-specific pseudouridylate synthase
MYLAAKRYPRCASKIWHLRFTSILVALLPIHWSSNLSSTEALLNPTRSTFRSLATLGDIPRRCGLYDMRAMRSYSTSTSVAETALSSDLAQNIRNYYRDRETDGIVELATSLSLMTDAAVDIEEDMVPAILEASEGQKGVAASIMNALIGSSCVVGPSSETGGLMSDRIILLMETLEEVGGIVPDIVTYSLAYQALSNAPYGDGLAEEVLEQAERSSKKIAGGKRRKLLASARRKQTMTFTEAEESLKELLGSDFSVLQETDDFAVISKPSGVPCFHKRATTAGKVKKGKKKGKTDSKPPGSSSDISLEDALVSCNVELSTLNPEALGLVHRLDRGSSGCLVLAKTNEMHAHLISEFFLRKTTKKYIALVQQSSESVISEEGSGVIEHPVGKRPAKSEYRLLEKYRSSTHQENAALIDFEIFTGRKHQIRVHAADVLKSPVWGDTRYGTNDDGNPNNPKATSDNSERIFLHASNLIIPGVSIDVKSPIPTWWEKTMSTFDKC